MDKIKGMVKIKEIKKVSNDDSKEYEATGEHFDTFKKEVEYWIQYFGMIDWELHIENTEEEDALGTCYGSIEHKLAGINLSSVWDEEPTEIRIKQIAFHEVTELFLYPLRMIMYERIVTEKEIENAIHTVIRTLENTVFKDKYKKHKCQCNSGGCKNEETGFEKYMLQ